MKTFSLNLQPAGNPFKNELEVSDLLTQQRWVIINDKPEEKETYIFRRRNRSLFISKNGKVEQGAWLCLDNKDLLIDSDKGSYLFHPRSLASGVLGLKLDGQDEYALLVNDELFEKGTKSVPDLVQALEQGDRPQEAAGKRQRKLIAREDLYILLGMLGAAAVAFEIFRLIGAGIL